MNRTDVYALIDGERDYQDNLWPAPSQKASPADKHHSVGDYLVMLHHYLTLAEAAWTTKAGDMPALDVIRKIGGIAVHCMEEHGAPARQFHNPKASSNVAQDVDLNVADPSKVYVLRYSRRLIDLYRNKIDARREAERLAERDGHLLIDYYVTAYSPVADSGARLPVRA
jgi:hypothetical protein